jgi:hypothetical protein
MKANTRWIYMCCLMDNKYELYQFTCTTVIVLIILLAVFYTSDSILIINLMFPINFNSIRLSSFIMYCIINADLYF